MHRCGWPIFIACLSPAGDRFDAVLFHQVLHYLDDPGAAVAEVARVMAPGGRLLIADFAPHELEFLREDYAHRRLGFSDREVEGWFAGAGLKAGESETIAPATPSAKSSPSNYGSAAAKSAPKENSKRRHESGRHDRQRDGRFRCRSNSPRPRRTRRRRSFGAAIKRLEPLQPGFVSVTYGAGGSTRERTHATVKRIVEETSLKPAAHLTCVGASAARSTRLCAAIGRPASAISWRLRGDMPGMAGPYQPARARLSLHARIDRRHPPHRAFRDQRLLLSGAASRFAQPWP